MKKHTSLAGLVVDLKLEITLSRTSINNVVAGNKNISATTLRKLAKNFGVKSSVLFNFEQQCFVSAPYRERKVEIGSAISFFFAFMFLSPEVANFRYSISTLIVFPSFKSESDTLDLGTETSLEPIRRITRDRSKLFTFPNTKPLLSILA